MSGVRLSRAYMPQMLKRNWGRVVFITSESALNIPADMVQYGMSQTAMLGLARDLAKVAAGTGVTVNSVLPGPTLSEGAKKILMASAPVGQTLEQAGAIFCEATSPIFNIRSSGAAEGSRQHSGLRCLNSIVCYYWRCFTS